MDHVSVTIFPNGCWFTCWTSSFQIGWWAQHGANREARKFFKGDEEGVRVGDIVRWVLSCHEHSPCDSYRDVLVPC
ncbi:hypothetical protein LCGC14_1215410 [marine sediment metagenome]|uniref:Uncharacterized protein n=1 Tax=marine sediment metagenome TaxID=412755 RepID=A0A0F9NV48_9ZZZZ